MKMIKKLLKNNKGFSLTEMIIVLAIIVIMTGASFISLSIMRSAKAKEAASTFETDLAYVISNAKNKDVDMNLDGTVDKGYSMGLRLYVSGEKIYLQRCLIHDGTYLDLPSADPYIQSVNVGNGLGTSLSAYVDIEYTDKDGNVKTVDEEGIYLAFNKKGECVHGVGTYSFLRKHKDRNEETTVTTVRVNQNGSYHVK